MFVFLDQKKQVKKQWLQDPKQSSVHNLKNARREASRHFRNKKKEYLKAKIDELENNSSDKNMKDLYRGINDFRECYQPRTYILKEENGDMFTDFHVILSRWRNDFSELLNVHGVSGVR